MSNIDFDKLLDNIKEKNIDRWDKFYGDYKVLDGYTWSLEINTKNIKINSYGINKIPKKFEDLLYLLDKNGVPLYVFDGPFD